MIRHQNLEETFAVKYYRLILGIKTISEFPVPDNNFLDSEWLFRPMTPTQDVKGSSSPNLLKTQLMNESVDEIVLFGYATEEPFQKK